MQKLLQQLFLLLVFIFGIIITISAKVDSLPIPELQVKEWIAKKWVITEIEARKQKVKVSDFVPYLFIEFTEDGLLVYMGEAEKIVGKWKYNHKNAQIICITNHEEEIIKILSIKEEELIIETIIEQEKLKMILKPI